jgi:hypothetical protein
VNVDQDVARDGFPEPGALDLLCSLPKQCIGSLPEDELPRERYYLTLPEQLALTIARKA